MNDSTAWQGTSSPVLVATGCRVTWPRGATLVCDLAVQWFFPHSRCPRMDAGHRSIQPPTTVAE